MRILFAYSLDDAQSLWAPLASYEDIQMGVSYISAMLKVQKHETNVMVLSPSMEKGAYRVVDKAMSDFDPEVIAFTAVFSQFAFMSRIAKYIRSRWPGKFLIIGGPHATLNAEEVINCGFDAVCVGEGELPTTELVNQLAQGKKPRGIANMWIRLEDGTIEKNPTRSFLQDLDTLPFPDRDMWTPWIREKAGARVSVFLGRGCPFQCTYCSNHALAKLADGKYVRFRSPANIISELRSIHEKYPDKDYIYLEVETIALDKKWLMALCTSLREFNASLTTPIAFSCNYRIAPQSMDEEIFVALEKANVISINIGLEAGSPRVRKEVLSRNYTNEDFYKVVEMARSHGMKINVFNLIGIPGETLEEHLETVEVNRRIQPDWIFKSIFFPYPGTRLAEVCKAKGLVTGVLDGGLERRKAILDLPGFSRRQIQQAYTWFEYRIYKGHRPPHKLLIKTLRNKVKSSAFANSLYLKVAQLPFFDKLRARGEQSINAFTKKA
ncbi:MAG: radical SAM protein [bacterium]